MGFQVPKPSYVNSSQLPRPVSGIPYNQSSGLSLQEVNIEPVIDVQDLRHTYPKGLAALQGVSFKVTSGEIFGLLGPNGGGKTTVFRILATLLTPSAGSARIFGYDVTQSAPYVRRSVGVVFQSQSLDKKLTVAENLRHQGHLYGLRGTTLRDRCKQLLAQFGLSDRAHHLIETLSGGMKRRVELAKGFLHRPKLLLLDEPSTGLDPAARLDFWHYLGELNTKEGVSILLTTHLMDEAEKCHRLGILEKGRLVALDSPESLKAKVGGDVIVLRAKDPQTLAVDIEKRFPGSVSVFENTVRIERPNGHEFIAELVEAFPGRIDAVTLSKPTLEDVFIHQTGHAFWSDNFPVTRT
jgi:ABC-2 type transport system ATP-binding protein